MASSTINTTTLTACSQQFLRHILHCMIKQQTNPTLLQQRTNSHSQRNSNLQQLVLLDLHQLPCPAHPLSGDNTHSHHQLAT